MRCNRMKRSRRRYLKKKRLIVLLLTGIIFIASIVTGSIAYLKDKDEAINSLKVGKIDVEIDEEFEPENGKKNVWIKNPSSTDALIRVNISGRFENSNDLSEVLPDGDDLVELIFSDKVTDNAENLDNFSWYYCKEDGYYYYTSILKGNATSEMLLKEVNFDKASEDPIFKDKDYKVEVKVEAVQATKYKNKDENYIYPYKEVWTNIINLQDKTVENMLDSLIL